MSRIAGRITFAGFLVVLFALSLVLSLWQRHEWSDVTVYVANRTDIVRTVRVWDASTNRILRSVRLDPQTRTLVAQHRLDVWWRDLSALERAAGLDDELRIELVTDACELISEALVDDREELTLEPDSAALINLVSDEPRASLPERDGADAVVRDPCDGRQAMPVGLVANQTTVPIAIERRIVVPACSQVLVRPGDLAAVLPAAVVRMATEVPAASIAVQRHRWPLEPRSIVVTRYDVFDDWGSADVDRDFYEPCGGLPLADHDLLYAPEDEP